MKAQILVSCKAIPLYTLLPPLSEHLILSGYTRAYGRISSVGLPLYLCHVALYMLSVEFGVYWQHRKLHEIKWAYSWLHRIHHVYNKENTLSPFAGLAFHPLDGLLQAVPYVWTLFLTPCHYFTHELLLFFTGIWTANIHDCIDGDCEPIMGAAYHTIHHTTYRVRLHIHPGRLSRVLTPSRCRAPPLSTTMDTTRRCLIPSLCVPHR